MIVGDRLAELLCENGVDYVFGVPGGQTLPLYEGIRKLGGRMEHVVMRDERSAGFAADAFARITGKTGVCDATVGPGATNLVSPLAEAHCSSIPMVAIISDIARSWEHRRTRGNASQAMDQLEMFRSVSKWQVKVTDPVSLDNIINTAFRIATTGRPGPVVVCIPYDVAATDFEFRGSVSASDGATYPRFRTTPDPVDVQEASVMLLNAKKPLLVVGGGAHISGCAEQVKELAERTQAAVVTSISGKGIIEEDHSQVFGVTGLFGNPIAKDVTMAADLVFYIGCKVGQLTTFTYRCPPRNTPIIHLDVDPEEIGRNYTDSHALLGDAALGLDAVLAEVGTKESQAEWDFSVYKQRQQGWYAELSNAQNQAATPVKPQPVMDVINQALKDDDLVVCDASLSSGWAAAFLQFSKAGRRCIAPRGLAGLGWGSPAAIGAALATKKVSRIIQIAGDGGFSYSLQELEVMKRLELPILTIILNNDVFGWIKHVQKDNYDENYISTDFSHVDFATVAKGFSARSYTARTLEEVKQFIAEEESPNGPSVIEVISDQWETPQLAL